MTREEAINKLADMDSEKYTALEAVALGMAIRSLEEQEDLQDALKIAREHAKQSAKEADRLMLENKRLKDAWEKVREEIEALHNLYKINIQGYSMSVAKECLEIINKHLQEVET